LPRRAARPDPSAHQFPLELLAHIGEITPVKCYEGVNPNAAVCQDVSDYSVNGAELPLVVQRLCNLGETVLDYVVTIREI
jgi:hypothetical protein